MAKYAFNYFCFMVKRFFGILILLIPSCINAQAAQVDVEKAANDVALNVASYYLQVLAANEQIEISRVQVAQTKAQYDITKRKVDVGALPELNLAELESQLATDSSNLITAQ